MIKIAHVREVDSLTLPQEVVTVVLDAVTILDAEYGENRDVDSGYGGYVLIIENESELKCLQEMNIEVETEIPEYVDLINCDNGKIFTSSLMLLGSDRGVVIIMPQPMLPANFKKYCFS